MLLELAILRLLSSHIAPGGQWAHHPGHLKSIYLAPSRALVQVGAALAPLAACCCPRLLAGPSSTGSSGLCLLLRAAATAAVHASLPQEKVRDWTQRFGALGITCRELTGAQGVSAAAQPHLLC